MSRHKGRQLRVLVLTSTNYHPPFLDEIAQLNAAGVAPDSWITHVPFDLSYLDQRFLTQPPGWRRVLYRLMPVWIAQVLEAFRLRRAYDVIFCWGAANVALVFALLLKLTRQHVPFVALLTWVSPAKKAQLLRAVHSHITRLVIPSLVQRKFAEAKIGVPAEKLIAMPWAVDLDFWTTSSDIAQDTICAAGREMRDYGTLIAALDGLSIPCHIAGSLVAGKSDEWRAALGDNGERVKLPDNITFGPKSAVELRELYARSRFVVLPLHHSDNDNGVTCMNEAWSMRRPVICSAVEGQRGAFEHGREGYFVPVGDVAAMREMITKLWNSQAMSTQMGLAGRRVAEERLTLQQFAGRISEALRAAAEEDGHRD